MEQYCLKVKCKGCEHLFGALHNYRLSYKVTGASCKKPSRGSFRALRQHNYRPNPHASHLTAACFTFAVFNDSPHRLITVTNLLTPER